MAEQDKASEPVTDDAMVQYFKKQTDREETFSLLKEKGRRQMKRTREQHSGFSLECYEFVPNNFNRFSNC